MEFHSLALTLYKKFSVFLTHIFLFFEIKQTVILFFKWMSLKGNETINDGIILLYERHDALKVAIKKSFLDAYNTSVLQEERLNASVLPFYLLLSPLEARY